MPASAVTATCPPPCSSPLFAAAAQPAPAFQVLHLASRAPLPAAAAHSPAVVLGAALRNTGVQPLLDAVVDFLPPPPSSTSKPLLASSQPHSSPETLAFAFKTVFDVKMGQELTYVRVYSGVLAPRQALYVSNSSSSSGGGSSIATERISSIFRILADEVQPLQQVIPLFRSRHLASTSSLFRPAAACG